MPILKKLISHFFPLTCPICKNNSIDDINSVCTSCLTKLEFIREPFCSACGGENDTIFEICAQCLKENDYNWSYAASVFKMKSLFRDSLIRYKYYKETPLMRPFAKFISEKIETHNISADYLTYIPLHWKRHFKRGFNQSRLLCQQTSKLTGIQSLNTLKRIKATTTQTKLDSKRRHKNLDGAFRAVNLKQISGKSLLLIDDVYTTGTTLREATKTLLTAKAAEVKILTLARR